jgi:hypothetical protein
LADLSLAFGSSVGIFTGAGGLIGVLYSDMTIVGGVTWRWFWHDYRHQQRTGLWHTYVLLVATLPAFAAMIGGVAALIHQTGVWLVGTPNDSGAADHFDFIPIAVAWSFVGLVVWWLHQRLYRNSTGPSSTSRRYVHRAEHSCLS